MAQPPPIFPHRTIWIRLAILTRLGETCWSWGWLVGWTYWVDLLAKTIHRMYSSNLHLCFSLITFLFPLDHSDQADLGLISPKEILLQSVFSLVPNLWVVCFLQSSSLPSSGFISSSSNVACSFEILSELWIEWLHRWILRMLCWNVQLWSFNFLVIWTCLFKW